MKKILILDKKEGETPLEALESFRSKNKKYQDVKMTYAGRLDPMASGVLLVLAGNQIKNKDKYLALKKEYEFEVLFGYATDTYDILGKVGASFGGAIGATELKKSIKNNLEKFTGKFIQKYPVYSSKTVLGKQLFQYGREGVDVEAPVREVVVKQLSLLNIREITGSKLLENIEKRISKVTGDFRQEEILDVWRTELGARGEDIFFIGKFSIKCGSGTYVRGISDSLGEMIEIPALAFSIKRTKVGRWSV